MKENEMKKAGGLPANALVFPLLVFFAILHILIVFLIIDENRSDDALADLMLRSGKYQQTATELQAGSSVLSETAASYVQIPLASDREPNIGPLKAYAEELGNDRRGEQVVERFRDYDVSDEVRAFIEDAAEQSKKMLELQLHAIALARSVYPTPTIPELNALPDMPLTEEELAMPDEARLGAAKQMLMNQEYSRLKYRLNEDIEHCLETLQKEIASVSARTQQHISLLRAALWTVVSVIIIALICTFFFYYRWMIRPLRSYARQISSDQPMEQMSIIREMRQMVVAYNTLLGRRNKLEAILRVAAETDALTGLPNRASFERAAMDIDEEPGAAAVLVFDVNFLKHVNDTLGHLSGDLLLRTAAECIRECFGQGDNTNCYRIGGDEFAVVLRQCREDEIRVRIDRFDLALERENISVSFGYAFSAETDDAGFRRLINEADKRMYEQKKHIHRMNGETHGGPGSLAEASG